MQTQSRKIPQLGDTEKIHLHAHYIENSVEKISRVSTPAEAGLRSDGELVQAVLGKAAGVFEFVDLPRSAEGVTDHGGWIEVVVFSAPTRKTGRDPDDDGGLPDCSSGASTATVWALLFL